MRKVTVALAITTVRQGNVFTSVCHTSLGRHPPGRHPLDRHPPRQTPTPPRSTSPQIATASYWNAFLFDHSFSLFLVSCNLQLKWTDTPLYTV